MAQPRLSRFLWKLPLPLLAVPQGQHPLKPVECAEGPLGQTVEPLGLFVDATHLVDLIEVDILLTKNLCKLQVARLCCTMQQCSVLQAEKPNPHQSASHV